MSTTLTLEIPEHISNTYEKMGEFWDSHDFTEFDDASAPNVKFDISCKISVEPDLLSSIEKTCQDSKNRYGNTRESVAA